MIKPSVYSVILLSALYSFGVFAATTQAKTNVKKKPFVIEDNEVYMRLVMRTPEQLSAFYQGREFKHAAIEKILDTCYVTPIIKNKKIDVLWLELDNWQFIAGDKIIKRINRDYWKKIWQEVKLPQAHQSTFGWTLMPEVRDLRIDEGVGGAVVIPIQSTPFTMIANFKTGTDKSGKLKTITYKNLTCVKDKK